MQPLNNWRRRDARDRRIRQIRIKIAGTASILSPLGFNQEKERSSRWKCVIASDVAPGCYSRGMVDQVATDSIDHAVCFARSMCMECQQRSTRIPYERRRWSSRIYCEYDSRIGETSHMTQRIGIIVFYRDDRSFDSLLKKGEGGWNFLKKGQVNW